MKNFVLVIFFIAVTVYAKDYAGKKYIDKAVEDFQNKFGKDFTIAKFNTSIRECGYEAKDIKKCPFVKKLGEMLTGTVKMLEAENKEKVEECKNQALAADAKVKKQEEEKNSTVLYIEFMRMKSGFDVMHECIMKSGIIEECGTHNIFRALSDVKQETVDKFLDTCEGCKHKQKKPEVGKFALGFTWKGCISKVAKPATNPDMAILKQLNTDIVRSLINYMLESKKRN